MAVKPKSKPQNSEKPLELYIIQCKGFAGTESGEVVVERLITWFKRAENYLKNGKYKNWAKMADIKRVFAVDVSTEGINQGLMAQDVEIWEYEAKLRELLQILKNEQKERNKQGPGLVGREEDALLRIFLDMINRGMINLDN